MDQVTETIHGESVPEETQEESQVTEEVVNEDVNEEAENTETEDTVEVEYVEIDRDGVKYSVPKELEAELMMRADHTRKTQEVAEQRKALEEQVTQFQQAAEAQRRNLQGHAQLAAIQSQLEQYQNVDWNAFSQNDAQAAQQAFFQYSQLKDAAANLGQSLQQQEAKALQEQHALRTRQLEQGKAELAKDIPGFNEQLASKIVNHGATYGFTESELRSVGDPRMVKVLNDARLYRESLKNATKQPKETVTPVAKVKGKAPVRKDPEKMSTDEWLVWRNKQIASR